MIVESRRVSAMGMESPETACHSEHVRASACRADDSYREALAVGVRSEAAPGRLFLLPRHSKEKDNKRWLF
jgi:hypothetical protein